MRYAIIWGSSYSQSYELKTKGLNIHNYDTTETCNSIPTKILVLESNKISDLVKLKDQNYAYTFKISDEIFYKGTNGTIYYLEEFN